MNRRSQSSWLLFDFDYLCFVFPIAPLFRGFAFEVKVSISLFEVVRRTSPISLIKSAFVEDKVRFVEGVIVLALTIDITFIK
jgi:hypothetical protein